MHASYIELEVQINNKITNFYIYENEETVFIYVGQCAPEVTLYNDILADKLKKTEPFRSKKSVIFCKLSDSKDMNAIVNVLKEMLIGESLDIIKDKLLGEQQKLNKQK